MRDRNGFSLAKKRIGAYFNDGQGITWVQRSKDAGDAEDPALIAAVQAAKIEFWRVYRARDGAA